MTEITEGAIEILGGLGCMFKQDVEVFVIGEKFSCLLLLESC